MNPCPCGYYSDPRKACSCNTTRIQTYMGKISGPLLDRIDIHIAVPAVKYQELCDTSDPEPSEAIKRRVETVRAVQRERLRAEGIFYNAAMNSKQVKKYCALAPDAQDLIKMAMRELALSARAYDKILRVGRTIADLTGSAEILQEHISEAIQYRNLDTQR
jgi:magnesium chelatase family protein